MQRMAKRGHGSRMVPELTKQGLQINCFSNVLLISLGNDYFTENFQVKENKTKMRKIQPRSSRKKKSKFKLKRIKR